MGKTYYRHISPVSYSIIHTPPPSRLDFNFINLIGKPQKKCFISGLNNEVLVPPLPLNLSGSKPIFLLL